MESLALSNRLEIEVAGTNLHANTGHYIEPGNPLNTVYVVDAILMAVEDCVAAESLVCLFLVATAG